MTDRSSTQATEVTRFRKKPVVIEALQLRWDTWSAMCDFAGIGKLTDGKPEGFFPGGDSNVIGLHIPTLEGVMKAVQDDWIIKGVKGELYSCKPDIFAATYEPVSGAPHSVDDAEFVPQKETP